MKAPEHWIGPDHLADPDDDLTTAALPYRPCANGCDAPMRYPHSICQQCVEKKREGRR